MLKNILIPEKIGNYYVFDKRVLSFEINHAHIQATLIFYRGRSIMIEKSEGLFLSEFSSQQIEDGIKKLTASIGKYDEITVAAPASQVIFKELEIPFLGREKIAMIIGFEIEPFLPFSYQEAVIDFLILDQDLEHKKSKIIVAAAKKSDIHNFVQPFEKLQLHVDQVTVDLFAFYTVYKKALSAPGKKIAELYIDIGIDSSTIVYINKGIFQGLRVVPFGLSFVAQKASNSVAGGVYGDVLQRLLYDSTPDIYNEAILFEVDLFIKQIKMSIAFFEKSSSDYQAPHNLFFYGIGSCLRGMGQRIQDAMSLVVEKLNLNEIIQRVGAQVQPQLSLDFCYSSGIVMALSIGLDNKTNVWLDKQETKRSRLFLMQFIALVVITLGSLGILYWNISNNISELETVYTVSKRELERTIENNMNIKIPANKSLKNIVSLVNDNFKKEKELWFSFSQQSFLQYLQKLSNIDRKDLELELTRVQLGYDFIIFEGSVEGWDQLSILQDEISLMQTFTIEEKPTEPTFSMKLKINRQDEL